MNLKLLNFLAHFFLSKEKDAWIAGNFLADYLRKSQREALPGPVQEGIDLHLEIDRFTDQHPMVLQGVRRLYPLHGKYAPVVMDVYHDYFLAMNWDRYSEEPFLDFTRKIYQALDQYAPVYPPDLQQRLPRMAANGWLESYARPEGLSYAFLRLQSRTSKPELLDGVMDTLDRFFPEIDREFNQFFPDIQDAVKTWKAKAGDYPSK